jgi:hypothetical protein
MTALRSFSKLSRPIGSRIPNRNQALTVNTWRAEMKI